MLAEKVRSKCSKKVPKMMDDPQVRLEALKSMDFPENTKYKRRTCEC